MSQDHISTGLRMSFWWSCPIERFARALNPLMNSAHHRSRTLACYMPCPRPPFSHIALSCFRTASPAQPSKSCWPRWSVLSSHAWGTGEDATAHPTISLACTQGSSSIYCTSPLLPPPAPSMNWFLNTFSLQLVLPNDGAGWFWMTPTVSLRATPCVSPIFRRAAFNGAPILFISHQNEMPQLFGETKAQEKIKHIKGSPKVLQFMQWTPSDTNWGPTDEHDLFYLPGPQGHVFSLFC